jgi:cupin fold WbuC family metalloprotein
MTNYERLLFGKRELDDLCKRSFETVRMRQHHNIHTDYSDPCQRLFIAMQPRSYVAPHRHTLPAKSETFIALRGSLGIVFFDDFGRVTETVRLGPDNELQVCAIAPGAWHTAVALEPNSVFMEVKSGPYSPIDPRDIAPWAPENEADQIAAFLDILYSHFADRNSRN